MASIRKATWTKYHKVMDLAKRDGWSMAGALKKNKMSRTSFNKCRMAGNQQSAKKKAAKITCDAIVQVNDNEIDHLRRKV